MIRPFLLDTWSLKNLTKCKEVRKGSDLANSAQCTLSKHVRVSIRSECAKTLAKILFLLSMKRIGLIIIFLYSYLAQKNTKEPRGGVGGK